MILDEIHAVAGTKRGTWLMSGVERLTELGGEMQRIALSATVEPADAVAALIGGDEARGRPRPVRIVRDHQPAVSHLQVEPIDTAVDEPDADADSPWRRLATRLRQRITDHRSTLIFTNARRTCEKLARFENEGHDPPLAYAHHGSDSKELRAAIERRLKRGELPAVVATGTLELGIDIGDCDQVLLARIPHGISSRKDALCSQHGTLRPRPTGA